LVLARGLRGTKRPIADFQENVSVTCHKNLKRGHVT
jgi:hypothetical protein